MNEKKVIESGIEYIVSTDKHGNKWWFHNEIKHRENGPAVEGATGDNEWWVNGKVVYIYDISIRFENGVTEEMLKQIIKYKLSR